MESRELLLEDAIREAIDANYKLIIWRRAAILFATISIILAGIIII